MTEPLQFVWKKGEELVEEVTRRENHCLDGLQSIEMARQFVNKNKKKSDT